ncbi:MAG: TM2 domain-containing protein [Alphaproteobacteria bacterium]|nr:TM2 domain-containing protein [Alphaproteobacteria bacterium]
MQRYLLSSESTHNGIIYIILAFFLGCIGIHNFYVGYWKRGLSQLALSLVSPYMMFIPLLFAALWATLEIFFVNRSANGCLLGGNRLVIWILRATSALVLAWAALSSDMSITALDLQSLAEI